MFHDSALVSQLLSIQATTHMRCFDGGGVVTYHQPPFPSCIHAEAR